jgi:hypothetical protein
MRPETPESEEAGVDCWASRTCDAKKTAVDTQKRNLMVSPSRAPEREPERHGITPFDQQQVLEDRAARCQREFDRKQSIALQSARNESTDLAASRTPVSSSAMQLTGYAARYKELTRSRARIDTPFVVSHTRRLIRTLSHR